MSSECIESKDGLHIWEDHFYPEVVDPATGEVLPDGERGELVLTSLTKEAMPVIRYRTRDLTRLLPGTARSMRRMEKITGRSDDMLIIRGVNLFPSQIEELILADRRLAPHYVLEIRREQRLDDLTVIAEARPDAADEVSPRRRQARSQPVTSSRGSASRPRSTWSSPAGSTARSARPSGSSICARRTEGPLLPDRARWRARDVIAGAGNLY